MCFCTQRRARTHILIYYLLMPQNSVGFIENYHCHCHCHCHFLPQYLSNGIYFFAYLCELCVKISAKINVPCRLNRCRCGIYFHHLMIMHCIWMQIIICVISLWNTLELFTKSHSIAFRTVNLCECACTFSFALCHFNCYGNLFLH